MSDQADQGNPVPYLPSMGRLFGFASKTTTELSEARLAPHDLSIPQWILLTALWRKDGLTVGEIAAYYQAREPTVSKLIDRMETKNLVLRRPDPSDRRVVRVHLTDKGKDLSPLIDFYKEINEVLLRGFSQDEARQFVDMLERATRNAKAALDEMPETPDT